MSPIVDGYIYGNYVQYLLNMHSYNEGYTNRTGLAYWIDPCSVLCGPMQMAAIHYLRVATANASRPFFIGMGHHRPHLPWTRLQSTWVGRPMFVIVEKCGFVINDMGGQLMLTYGTVYAYSVSWTLHVQPHRYNE